MAKRGRQTKLDEERGRRIVADLAAGLTRRCTCARNGIALSTFTEWLARGKREKDGPFAVFYGQVKKAEADAEAFHVANIQKVAKGGYVTERITVTRQTKDGPVTTVTERVAQPTWTASAWFLERTKAEDWSRDNEALREIKKELQKKNPKS